jgi:chromosome segregation ATPase
MPDVPTEPDPQTRITELEERLARAESAPVRERGRHMADEHEGASTRFLQKQVEELQKALAESNADAKRRRIEAKNLKGQIDTVKSEYEAKVQELQSAHEALQTEYDDFLAKADQEFQTADQQVQEWRSKAETSPDEMAQKLRDLETQIKTRDVKAKFKDLESTLSDGFDLDTAFEVMKFDPTKVEDIEKLDAAELAKQWREARAGLFKPGETPKDAPGGATQGSRKPPLTVAEELPSRGGRDSVTGKVQYKQSELAQPGWYVSKPSLHKALAEGNAERIEE